MSSEPRPKPATTSQATYQQQAYEYVKMQILNVTFKAGEYITDSAIAAALGISRTPVREALRRLEQEGLLVNEARRGWKVYALSLDDIKEIFELKEIVEGLIARRAAECEDEALRASLRESMEQMRLAAASGDYDAWRRTDVALHQVVCTMCRNGRAVVTLQNLDDQWFRLRPVFVALEGRMEESMREHESIVSSILGHDGDQAEQSMRTHVGNVREALVKVMRMVLPLVRKGV